QNTSPLPIGFEIVGSGLAVGSVGAWDFKRITRGGDDILWRANEPHFATAFVQHSRDGLIYLFGTVKGEDGVQRCYLACVEPEHVGQVERYKYLASAPSPRWSGDIADAAPIFDRMPSELSVSCNVHLGCFLAVHSLDLTGQI